MASGRCDYFNAAINHTRTEVLGHVEVSGFVHHLVVYNKVTGKVATTLAGQVSLFMLLTVALQLQFTHIWSDNGCNIIYSRTLSHINAIMRTLQGLTLLILQKCGLDSSASCLVGKL